MAREDPQFKLRMTEELRDRITDAAAKSGRSMNAELVHRLQRSFDDDDYYASIRDTAYDDVEEVEAATEEPTDRTKKYTAGISKAIERFSLASKQLVVLSMFNRYSFLLAKAEKGPLSKKERAELSRIKERYGDPPELPSLYGDE